MVNQNGYNNHRAEGNEEVCNERKKVIRTTERKYNNAKARRYRIKKKNTGCHLEDDTEQDILSEKIKQALEIASGPAPIFTLKKSKIAGAGNGVFVSEKHEMVPAGSIIPYTGRIVLGKTPEVQSSQYVVQIKENTFLVGNGFLTDGQALGNFVNRVVSKNIWNKLTSQKRVSNKTKGQNLSEKNATLRVTENIAYFILDKNLSSGEEILTTYGKSYRIVRPKMRS